MFTFELSATTPIDALPEKSVAGMNEPLKLAPVNVASLNPDRVKMEFAKETPAKFAE